ncbi:hypothetical protein [Xanthocytophaga agilis]|uniref:DUF4261 domain-containing protein n=1 Tax=Xanthocytophaga agilis TaxID=3048010 RepID=A0AAE3R4M6_9BACT|nr:hypothetical protein [Xanthocytophaga agilis]MDJ1503090.1 hypothetical protein [Xanthocytophaga agilis]
MGLFSKLFGTKENTPKRQVLEKESGEKEKDSGTSCMLLYESIPQFDAKSLESRIQKRLGGVVSAISCSADLEGMTALLSLEEDQIILAGLYFSYPKDVLDTVLQVCHFSQEAKQTFYQSQAHIFLTYRSTTVSPHLQYDRLYQSIGCLQEEDNQAIGVIQESAMTAHPIDFLSAIESERKDLLAGKSMPFMSWIAWTGGCVKYILDQNTIWFVTKGNHNFGLPEFAFKGRPDQGNSTMQIFNALFAYMYFYKAVLAPGHTADLAGLSLKFSAVEEYKDLFTGKYGTLVVSFR